ncbi:hypothetical protein Ddye_030800 [Dipteronia dyeriana]|uniref:F-box domain-containing protein n=1 Tax=Dipteronia dyeriana TaxID=168575 RepID=A0AAD9TI29_9ROSI|nr:hypothetical protein Ddye_030800 [Dipteronia dyeriana]
MSERELLSIEEESKPSFKEKKSEPQQYWSGLPKDILRFISEKLPWSERLRFSLVRKTWKECFHEIKNTQEFLPWLMFYNWDKSCIRQDENNGRFDSICKLADHLRKNVLLWRRQQREQKEIFFFSMQNLALQVMFGCFSQQ